mmetsp:Transcript_3772/g.11748  ORF Transcript_3772/g.11748 Transcript_3772/m.11748 type:complete len:298 (-) Transcript_3772:1024-1917(-)
MAREPLRALPPGACPAREAPLPMLPAGLSCQSRTSHRRPQRAMQCHQTRRRLWPCQLRRPARRWLGACGAKRYAGAHNCSHSLRGVRSVVRARGSGRHSARAASAALRRCPAARPPRESTRCRAPRETHRPSAPAPHLAATGRRARSGCRGCPAGAAGAARQAVALAAPPAAQSRQSGSRMCPSSSRRGAAWRPPVPRWNRPPCGTGSSARAGVARPTWFHRQQSCHRYRLRQRQRRRNRRRAPAALARRPPRHTPRQSQNQSPSAPRHRLARRCWHPIVPTPLGSTLASARLNQCV